MKKDIGLILIGMCFGIFICSLGVFLVGVSSHKGNSTSTPISYPNPDTKTPIFTDTSTLTSTVTPFSIKDFSTFTTTYTPTVTPTFTKTFVPTKTSRPTKTVDIRSLYNQIPNRELFTYADNHKGEKVKVRGTVFNINNTKELQIFAGGSSDYPMYLVFDSSFSGIYVDDVITVYATVFGQECGTNAFGGQICQPTLMVDFYEK